MPSLRTRTIPCRTPVRQLCAVAALACGAVVQAAPVVATGSHYDLVTWGGSSGPFYMPAVTFDGQAEQFVRSLDGTTSHFTVVEQQTDLGGGHWQILVTIDSDSNMFPYAQVPGEFGGMRLGLDPLDLLRTLRLDHATMRATFADGTSVDGPDWVASYPNLFGDLDHWSGCFMECNRVAVYGGMGAYDTRRLTLDLRVSDPTLRDLPEPTPLGLLAMAGVVAGWRRLLRRQTGSASGRSAPAPSSVARP